MKIEILYVPGCPNYRPAVERVQKVLVSESLRADIEGIPVSSEVAAKGVRVPRITDDPRQRNGCGTNPQEYNRPSVSALCERRRSVRGIV